LSVFKAIHLKPWRILHLAGHGTLESPADGPPMAGLVLDGGQRFSPIEARNMRVIPELVFLNCCHLGSTKSDADRNRHQERAREFRQLSQNLATEFTRLGSRAVVAAGSAADDQAAKTFAIALYDAMVVAAPSGE